MSIYDDEGALRAEELGRKIEFDTGMAWNVHDGVLVLKEAGSSTSPVICKIRDTACQFQVAIHGGSDTRYAMAYRFILGYVIHLRGLAEAARETGNEPKIKPITEAEMATMDPPFPPEQIENARNKIPEKLTTGLVKPERVAKIMPPKPPMPFVLDPDDFPGNECEPQEPAPTEPTLRALMVMLHRAAQDGSSLEGIGCGPWSQIADWIDARLHKEESDG